MAFQRYFLRDWNRIPTSGTDSEKPSTCFDCNICLDFARDPVVTLCGHLYCWPCIYKWVNTQTASLPSGQLPRCPVCKAETSEKTMVPLYGRGQPLSETDHERKDNIPPRPPAFGLLGLVDLSNPGGQPSRNPYQYVGNYGNRHVHDGYLEPHLVPPPAMSHPLVGMLGEMVYTRIFGNAASLSAYPNSYHSAGSSTPRLRRREMEADESLNRVCIFLFCCFILCLFLF